TVTPPVKAAAAADTSIRVDTQRLDRMMNLVGEMVLVRNRLKTLTATAADEELAKTVRQVDFITRSLQDAVMQIRMLPIRKVFSRFPKVARDVARSLGKQVDVELVGEDTDLDKNLVEALGDPLIHMVRNAVDHGIEMPEQRQRSGKPAAGKLVLAACQQGDHIVITVRDDGAGMDAERLRAKVVEKGLMDAAAAARLTHGECFQLVFLPGFSTKEQISDLSGRGVGMDVVKSAITQLNGSVRIDSVPGQGSCVEIRVPLTLAILPALMVAVAERVYALPLASVADVTVLDNAAIRKLDAWDVVLLHGQIVRLVYLDRWAGVQPADGEPRHVALVRVGDEQFGFVVDQVIGREEVVIKPLGAMLRGLSGLSGATVTGAGRVALILDCASLVRSHGHPG
ncbi:MAG TPA: chemotaxis protein CheA, partial [Stenotrophobium sp.]|nr:chemotaxis protein CheA [Stenotrophobium sp.]